MVEAKLDISVHVYFDVLKFGTVLKVELLNDGQVFLYELLGDFEIVAYDFELDHLLLYPLGLFLSFLLSDHLSILIILYLLWFDHFLELWRRLAEVVDFFRYFI